MGGLLTVLLPALIPALTDGARGLIGKFTGGAGARPQNIGERVQLMQAETERLRALAELDKPIGEPSKWVIDARAIFRYAAVAVIWAVTAACIFTPGISPEFTFVMLDLAGGSMSFIIGERFYLKIKGE